MTTEEPLLREDGGISYESVSSTSSKEECHEAPQVSFVTSICRHASTLTQL